MTKRERPDTPHPQHAQITQRQAQMASLHAPPPLARAAASSRAGGATVAEVLAQKRRVDELRRRKEEMQARLAKLEKDVEREVSRWALRMRDAGTDEPERMLTPLLL